MKTDCASCPLKGRPKVPSFKPHGALLTIVGESPGKQEEREMTPFVGHTGQQLRSSMSLFGIDEYKTEMVNTISCRPWATMSKGQWRKAIACCRPRVEHELETSPSKVLLLCGSKAAHLISADIKRFGGLINKRFGKTTIVTHHPTAAFLRTPEVGPVFLTHLRRAWALATGRMAEDKGPEVIIEEPEFAAALLRILHSAPGTYVGVDIESVGGPYDENSTIRCIGLGNEEVCVSIPTETQAQRDKWVSRIQHVFNAQHLKFSFHNGLHDIPLMAKFGLNCRNDFDTMCAGYVLSPGLPHTLAYTVGQEMVFRNWKDDFKSLKRVADEKLSHLYAKAPIADLQAYNCMDCYCTARCARTLSARLDKHPNGQSLFGEQMRLTYDLGISMSRRGIHTDRKVKDRLEMECIETLNSVEAKIRNHVGAHTSLTYADKKGRPIPFNPRSNKHLHDLYFTHFKVKPLKFNEECTSPSLDKEALSQYLLHRSDVVRDFTRLLLEHRKWAKRYGTYIRDVKPVVHSTWQSYGAKTGRWSSKSPNLQNIDNSIRDLYCARPGHVLVKADYSQLELKVAAVLSKDFEEMDAYTKGADGHRFMAHRVFEVPYDEVTKKQRRAAKTINFAKNYGATADTVHANLVTDEDYKNITLAQVNFILERAKANSPRFTAWKEALLREVQTTKRLVLPLSGRTIYFWGRVKPTEVSNYPIQGTAGDIINRAIWQVYQELELRDQVACVLLQVHDEINLEVEEHRAREVATRLLEIMERKVTIDGVSFVFTADAKIGTNWGSLEEFNR